jgi:hypothetical protein
MGAAQHALPGELVEVAPNRNRRDAETRLDLRDGDRAGAAQRIDDLAPAGLGQDVAFAGRSFVCDFESLVRPFHAFDQTTL